MKNQWTFGKKSMINNIQDWDEKWMSHLVNDPVNHDQQMMMRKCKNIQNLAINWTEILRKCINLM